jgi:hypothetical protein
VFGVSPDGQRVLVGKIVQRTAAIRGGIRVIVNGIAALAAGSTQTH